MDQSGEQPRFEIQPTIEQKPFESPAVQSFFAKWCEINDSIEPQIISRDDWEQRGVKGILEKRPDGKQLLYIPEDLHLWEMIGVMEVVDHDTFVTKPERQNEAKKKLLELGRIFESAGVYIAQRLDSIEQGKDIARALAEEFYGYGQSLTSGGKSEEQQTIDDITSYNLTASELDAVDRFLAGDNLYQSRRARAEKATATDPDKKEEFYEIERQKALAKFFRASAKAFELERKSESGELRGSDTHLKPWQNDAPIHSAFITKIEKAMAQKIETPKRELEGSIFRRGMELLQRNMPFDKLPEYIKNSVLQWQNGETTLRDALQIDKLKQELESYRKGEISIARLSYDFYRHCDDLARAYENTNIQLAREIKKIAYDPRADYNMNLFKKIERLAKLGQLPQKEIDKLREKFSLQKLISAKEHEIADKIQKAVSGFPYQSDANNPSEMVANQYINCVGASTLGGALMREAGLNYLVGDVPGHSILFLVTSDGGVEWRDMLKASFNENLTDGMIKGRKKDESPLTVADVAAFSREPKPEGLMFDLTKIKIPGVKEGQRQYVTVFEPEYGQQIQILHNTGNALYALGRKEEAIEAYRQAIAVDPKYAYPYHGLGNALDSLGRNKEAIEAYQKFIDLSDEQKDDYFIKRAERIIAELQSRG